MYGIGDFGPAAYRFVDFLAQAHQSYWQILPLNPPILTKNRYSPYNCLSAFAGNTLLISPELLYRQGLLSRKDIQDGADFPEGCIDYRRAVPYKRKLLNVAFERFKSISSKRGYEIFCEENRAWLEGYATFVALREHFGGRLWYDWPAEFRDRKKRALKDIRTSRRDAVEREKFLQYVFFEQWFGLKQYCKRHRIRIIGDIPFYVAYDSAAVWGHPEIFKLTRTKKPRVVAGVPPDFFSRTGQLWGNPIYDWAVLRKKGYGWWFRRMKHNLNLFDIVRLDHFRGFVAYWQVKAGSRTAMSGKWVDGPKEDFFNKLLKRFPSTRIIVEDLGYITADVRALIDKFRFPCMKVLLFAFDGEPATNPHCPHNHVSNCVVCTGTHDNNTVKGWFEKEAKPAQKKNLFDYLGRSAPATQVHWDLIRLAMSSVGNVVVIPMQDVLGLGEEARMNRPARARGNWRWRLCSGQIRTSVARNLAQLTKLYGRG
jgi:4-alpha-glucanotransferase